jgi:uncharacterized protein (TIGR00730 family)
MAHICVYCGAANDLAPHYIEVARTTGRLLADRGHTLVYGGGNRGLMGETARATHKAGGKVVGVIPQALVDLEQAYTESDELIVSDGLRDRKAILEARSDGFVVLPGGLGTMDELFEVLTLRQLRLHNKPIILVDTNDYFQPFIRLIEHIHTEGFVRPSYKLLYEVVAEPLDAIRHIEDYKPTPIPSRFA